MELIYAPNPIRGLNSQLRIFLAGSIEMGTAENWQEKFVKEFEGYDVQILNPRRPDWDSSWKQDPQSEPFRSQVQWEQRGITCSDIVVVNFVANTQSPITLLELGLILGQGIRDVFVCCPPEYFRYGNVYITNELYNHPGRFFETTSDLIAAVKAHIHKKGYKHED